MVMASRYFSVGDAHQTWLDYIGSLKPTGRHGRNATGYNLLREEIEESIKLNAYRFQREIAEAKVKDLVQMIIEDRLPEEWVERFDYLSKKINLFKEKVRIAFELDRQLAQLLKTSSEELIWVISAVTSSASRSGTCGNGDVYEERRLVPANGSLLLPEEFWYKDSIYCDLLPLKEAESFIAMKRAFVTLPYKVESRRGEKRQEIVSLVKWLNS